GAVEPRLTQLRAALADVARRMPEAGRAQVDARFADMVVVRLPKPVTPAPAPQPVSQTRSRTQT
ncbi:MAG TPA: hypothetical protein VGX50_02140, partial [Longimicrobium sp.]|nr:hypothetical protein [Longimicrobium sp.]